MEFLVPHLEKFCNVYSASGQQSLMLRLFSWISVVLKYGKKADRIFLDVYSSKYFYGIVILAIILKALKLDYICVLRGGDLPTRLKKNKILCGMLFGNRKLLSPSRYLYEAFLKHGFDSLIIPNAVESEFFLDEIPNREPDASLLYVRSLKQIYNPIMALKTLKILRSSGFDAKVVMIGSSDQAILNAVESYVKENRLEDHFEYRGVLSKREWHQVALNNSIYLSTPNFDNTPVSMLEAMNLGLLIASTNVGGVPYLVEDGKNAILFPPDDAETAANKLKEVLSKPSMFHRIRNSSMEEGKKYRLESVLPLWEKLLVSN